MKYGIIGGDFPKGATLEPVGFLQQDIEIRWFEGFRLKRESLKGNIQRIEQLDKDNLPDKYTNGLTPLEGGIIGGSVAGFNGFLAGYLSLLDNEEGVLFACYLNDGRYFIAITDARIFNMLLEI